MFCQLDRLRRCLSPRIRRTLNELPETLDETYERTLLDIDEENWAYAHRLFQCIVVARRPLRVEELAEFLALKSEAGGSLTFEGNWRPENPRDMVLSTCSSLVAVINVDGLPVVQFSHFSVKEYLTSSRIAKSRVSRYYIPLEPAHLFVTQACLSILLQLDKHASKQSIKEELPLALYAGQYWADHAEFGDVSSHTEDTIKRVFSSESHHFATNWVWIYDTISDKSIASEGHSRPKWAPLHYAAKHGFHRVAEWLITTRSQDVNASGNFNGWTPLHLASWFKHSEVVRLLLAHGADVTSKTEGGETPLHLLSEHGGNLEVAQLLLEHGADPSVRSSSGRDSLYMALGNGQPGHVQLLLKHGADPNSRGVNDQTLLHVVSRLGDPKVAQGLLELDVDINSRDKRGRTPLQVALHYGNEQVVQLFLQHGAKRT